MKFRIPGVLAVLALVISSLALSSPAAHSSGSASAGAGRLATSKVVAGKGKDKKKPFRPARGALFNTPVGGPNQRLVIERHILAAIKNTKKKQTIRIAAYSLDRMPVAYALAAAKKRGVHVQLLLNDHQVTRAQRYLRGVLGRNRNKRSFIWECDSGCRAQKTDYNNLHSKFYLFSKTGKAHNVVMLGSANMTLNAVKWQWNDLWTERGNEFLYDNFVSLFKDMKVDYNVRQRYYEFCGEQSDSCSEDSGKLYSRVFPKAAGSDPVTDLLHDVHCVYDTPQGQRRTKVWISMHTMRGKRGERLGVQIRQKFAEGCDVRLIFGLMGFYTKQKLTAATPRGRMPLRSTGFDINADGEVERYTHQKYAVIEGKYRGQVGSVVFTGSSNWSSLGLPQDELIFSIRNRPRITRQYQRNFLKMWQPRYSRNAYTTTYASYRTVQIVNGLPTVTVKRVPVTTVRPDGLKPGRTWEND